MEELYRMIEETIKATGYNGKIDGQDIYEDIFLFVQNSDCLERFPRVQR